ncbi:MAG: TMEM165/GDT1 family protein [Ethanoligenens sp.]
MTWLTVLPSLTPFLTAAIFVTLNELGDKSQLLTIGFSSRMNWMKVLLGVLIATITNHGLAVAVGTLLARVPGWDGWVRFLAAILFLFFGLWALKPETEKDEKPPETGRFGDVATVAFAFFFAEMGDKTQLATIALAAQFPATPLLVLAGAAVGMLLADSIGMIVGILLHRRLTAGTCRLVASVTFVLFGLFGVYEGLIRLLRFSGAGAAVVVTLAAACIIVIGAGLRKEEKRRKDA